MFFSLDCLSFEDFGNPTPWQTEEDGISGEERIGVQEENKKNGEGHPESVDEWTTWRETSLLVTKQHRHRSQNRNC